MIYKFLLYVLLGDWEVIESLIIDFIKTIALGVVLGLVIAEVNMWLIKREVKKVSKSLISELSRHLRNNGEIRERVEEYARVAGQVFGKEIVKVVLGEVGKVPKLPKLDDVSKEVERLKNELSL